MKTREQLEATGNKILNSVRTELYLSMRFMGPALGSLGFAMDLSTRTVGTDAGFHGLSDHFACDFGFPAGVV